MANVELNAYLNKLFDSAGGVLNKAIDDWCKGIDYEVSFWSKWFDTKGLNWPQDYADRLAPQPLKPHIVNLLPDRSFVHVLDVGAGPISRTGSFIPGREGEVMAVDPLAAAYDRIIKQSGVAPPIRTQFSFAEDLSARLDNGKFDLITCTNALDHSLEPMWGILEMMLTLSIGGRIYLSHIVNEAENENYSGFHQWNFEKSDEKFHIWNRSGRTVVDDILGESAKITTTATDNWIETTIEKVGDLNIDLLNYQRRLRGALLEAVIAREYRLLGTAT